MKIEIESMVKVPRDVAWATWNDPDDIKRWSAASDDWHTTASEVDLREGGRFSSRMEAKDGSAGFDFAGTYTRVDAPNALAYRLDDDREVTVTFEEHADGTLVRETFDADASHDAEMQRAGWQAILDNFARYVEAKNRE